MVFRRLLGTFNRNKTMHRIFIHTTSVSIGTVDILSWSLKVFSTNHNRLREAQGKSLLQVMENGKKERVLSLSSSFRSG